MSTLSVTDAGLPLARGASFRVERTEAGTWLADDPEVECYAEGDDPSGAIAALLQAELEYLAILRKERERSPLTERHLGILAARLV